MESHTNRIRKKIDCPAVFHSMFDLSCLIFRLPVSLQFKRHSLWNELYICNCMFGMGDTVSFQSDTKYKVTDEELLTFFPLILKLMIHSFFIRIDTFMCSS